MELSWNSLTIRLATSACSVVQVLTDVSTIAWPKKPFRQETFKDCYSYLATTDA